MEWLSMIVDALLFIYLIAGGIGLFLVGYEYYKKTHTLYVVRVDRTIYKGVMCDIDYECGIVELSYHSNWCLIKRFSEVEILGEYHGEEDEN